jgi:hypothetical protein
MGLGRGPRSAVPQAEMLQDGFDGHLIFDERDGGTLSQGSEIIKQEYITTFMQAVA